jgi:hypothetical protein
MIVTGLEWILVGAFVKPGNDPQMGFAEKMPRRF